MYLNSHCYGCGYKNKDYAKINVVWLDCNPPLSMCSKNNQQVGDPTQRIPVTLEPFQLRKKEIAFMHGILVAVRSVYGIEGGVFSVKVADSSLVSLGRIGRSN